MAAAGLLLFFSVERHGRGDCIPARRGFRKRPSSGFCTVVGCMASSRETWAGKSGRWGKIAGREFSTVAITMFGLLLVTFLIARVMPIDPVLAVVGDRAPADVYDKARLDLGLDKPLWQQFGIY